MGPDAEIIGERIERPSLSDIVCARLEQMILSREIQPGKRINESKLSRVLGVSRAPIREACRQLERLWMVEVIPRRGTFVREIHAEEVEDLYDIRAILDEYAGRKAASKIRKKDMSLLREHLSEMESATEQNDPGNYFRANLAFHQTIFDIAGNKSLPMLYEGITKRAALFRKSSLSIPGRLAVSLQQHREIFEALSTRDAAKTAQLMKDHVVNAKQAVLDSLDQP